MHETRRQKVFSRRCVSTWLGVLACTAWSGSVVASDLSTQLKQADHVLLIRHAYAPGVGDPPGYNLERCETQRVLNDEGRQQAQRIGQWLRARGVVSARVYSSVWCRCQQTASLLQLGAVTIEPSLASFFDQPEREAAQNQRLQAFIRGALRSKGEQALILVTHHVNIRAFMGRDIGSGDMVLARVDAQGRMLSHQIYPSP